MNSGSPVTRETLSLQFKRCYFGSGSIDFEYGPLGADRSAFGKERGGEPISRQLWDEELKPLLQESKDLAPQIRHGMGPGSEVGFTVYEYTAYVIGNAAAWPSLAGVLKAYLRRRSDRKVVIYGDDGQKLFEATGDLSASEIEALLKARVGTPKADVSAAEQEPSSPEIAPNNGYILDQGLPQDPE
jgi:hypothetical protein